MKCCNHPEKEASAICERCNLLYCGSCVLSSNGKCPKCGNLLRSPQSVMSYEINQDEIYKGRGQPHLLEAVNSLYMEPQRAMRRLKEYSSILTGVITLTILYLILTVLRVLLAFLLAALFMPVGGADAISSFLDGKTILAFFIATLLYFGVFIFGWLFSSLVYLLPAKLLGGKGEYVQQASLLAYIMFAIFPIGAFSVLLAAIPQFGPFIAFLASAIVVVYLLYLIFLSIREINQFNTMKALASSIISLAIFVFTALLIAGISMLILALLGNLPQPSF
jgi:hypothetical protein